ncbi:sodium:solute symporter family protein [Phocaeicola sartorii]|uniref:Solute:sodium symporter (SSS) family transporter n=1 Tax=Phocaeicola sartorii TaxID=671267 RepID=R9IIF0_9BACT|nr:sodium:solute symporter [Phocaeicola sartorii]EOS13791.1 solute:sodium symporter (SSS) family transporter [Phocaeicola sartorii]MCR1844059.1 sodium:solute symporter [Phocaeicola sartorii]
MHIIDIIIFLLFTGGVVAFGCSFFKKKGTSEEFTSAGRSLPGWVVGMSIFATYVSSISYLGYPGKAFSGDWNAFVFSLSIPIASYFAARYFVPFYRSQDSISAYSFLENRFGPWARIYASSCYLLTQIARTGSILYLLALPMNVLLGWHIQTIIIVTSVAIVLYSMLGGMKAVIWTEAIQGIILIGGALVCMFILLFDMPGGPAQTFSIAMEDGKFSMGSFGSSLSESTFWVCLIYGVFTNLQNYGIDQSYVQRYHTAKSEKEAKFSALFGGYLFIPVSAVFFMIGTGLYAFYKVHPGVLPDGVGADYVFPFFIVNELPVGLTGLLIASIFAAGMSTIATSVTSSSTIILTDYYQHFRKHAGNMERMLVLKLSSVGVGVAGILVAFAFMSVQSALDAWWALASIFSGGMLGLFLLGYISRKARKFDAVLGVVCGVILVCWIVISPFVHANLAIVFGTLLIFLVGFLSANLFNKRRCK